MDTVGAARRISKRRAAPCDRLSLMAFRISLQRVAMYIVTSKPKRKSV
ncbi:hypothetical protein B0G57_10566 [Trinickia symbiotica]|nr:hypothetical protein B0G57_10566 [Trinickia symbiotica]